MILVVASAFAACNGGGFWGLSALAPQDVRLSISRDIEPEPWPRIGRPPKHAVEAWIVTVDWSNPLPITDAELNVFEAWFGDLFDEVRAARIGRRPWVSAYDLANVSDTSRITTVACDALLNRRICRQAE